MLAKTLKTAKQIKYPIFTSPKLDGVRAFYRQGKLYTRNGKEITSCPHILKALKDVNTNLDGELYVHGVEFNELSGLIRRQEEEVSYIEYHIFDIPSSNLSFKERLYALHRFYTSLTSPFIRLVPHYYCESYKDIWQRHEQFLKDNYEGSVLKTPHHRYQFLKRSNHWLKLVPIKSEDLKCIGWEPGTGKYQHAMGKLLFDFNGKVIKVGTGFTDADRIKYYANPPIGAVAIIEHKGLTPYGKLRQPVFKGWRYDKDV